MKHIEQLKSEREQLLNKIVNFQPVSVPEKIIVKDGGEHLPFRFDQASSKCVDTPPAWGWAKGYSYRELLQYFDVHSYTVVKEEVVA